MSTAISYIVLGLAFLVILIIGINRKPKKK